jgi:hypothetical protein
METSVGLPRVITGGVSVVKTSLSCSRILARTTYRLAATIFAGSYAKVNRMGGLPGLATRVVAMIDRFFQSLDRVVQIEPWLTRNKVMIDMLKSIGIEKGKPFNPNQETRDILNATAQDAKAWLDARYNDGFPSFYEGRQWAFPGVRESSSPRISSLLDAIAGTTRSASHEAV